MPFSLSFVLAPHNIEGILLKVNILCYGKKWCSKL